MRRKLSPWKRGILRFAAFFGGVAVLAACAAPEDAPRATAPKSPKKIVQANFPIEVNAPTVGITNYTLISDDLERDKEDARKIIEAKVLLPLAMQKHDPELFDRVLASDFTYQGEEALLDRAEYISDRVNAKWMITDVQYENLVLEFFDGYGVLTYRNKVKEKDEFGKDQLYTWFWTDVWVKENGEWRLRELRAIN